MSRSIVVRWFFGSLIGLAGGVVLLIVSGAVSKSGSSESVEVRGLGQESASSGLRVRIPVRYV